MNITNFARPFLAMLLIMGLVIGCASTPDEPAAPVVDKAAAEQAISDAKSANAEAKAMGVEWRDTGKMIKDAEAAMAAEDYAKAVELANEAKRQAENAMKQAKSEAERLKNESAAAAGMDESSSTHGAAMVEGGVDQYQVSTGDNLWNISGKGEVYANPYEWPLIYKANRDKIKDADLIYPGQVFDIDRAASSADVDAAIQHAKTRGAWTVGEVEASDSDYMSK